MSIIEIQWKLGRKEFLVKRDRATLLSTRQTWISLGIIVLFVSVVAYAIITWQYERAKSQETMEVVFATVKHVSPFVLPMIVIIVGFLK